MNPRTASSIEKLAGAVAQASAVLLAALALAALAGWMPGRLVRGSPSMGWGTAAAFLATGAALFGHCRWSAKLVARRLAFVAAGVVALTGLIVLGRGVAGAAAGWMSPIAGLGFVLAALALMFPLLRAGSDRPAAETSIGLGVGVGMIGLVVLVGYALGSPVLYGGRADPITFPTGAAFVLLGIGLSACFLTQVANWRVCWQMVATFGLGVALSVGLFAVVESYLRKEAQSDLDDRAEMLAGAFRKRLDGNLDAVQSIGALFASSRQVDRREFQTFATHLLAWHRGIRSLQWMPRVPDARRIEYEAAARRDGYPGFQITDRNALGQMTKAARRIEYFPVFYVEPLKGNEPALGFDPASEPERAHALRRACDSARTSLAAPITLVQETETQRGAVAYTPVYRSGVPGATVAERRANLIGFAVGVFRLGDLANNSLEGLDREGLNFRLWREPASTDRDLLHAESGASPRIPGASGWSTTLPVADQQWRFEVFAASEILAAYRVRQSWGVLGAVLGFTVLLGAYLFAAARHSASMSRTHYALHQALAEVKRSQERFLALFVTSRDALMLLDEKGFFDCNEATLRLFRCGTKEEFIRLHPADLSPALQPSGTDSRTAADQRIHTALSTGSDVFEWRHRRLDGEEFAAEVLLSSFTLGGREVLQATVRDITDRKRLIHDLEESLANVRTLKGLLPICAGCKKIRNDKGYWDHVETYISKHTDATFTHGLCPECIPKYFPGIEPLESPPGG